MRKLEKLLVMLIMAASRVNLKRIQQNHVLVFMVTGSKGNWHYPIAYSLTNSTNTDIQAQIIRELINFLTESHLDVHAVIFDGTSKNLTTAEKLGCKISSNFDGSCAHPCREGKHVFTILDACHMIKLAKIAFADKFFITQVTNTIML